MGSFWSILGHFGVILGKLLQNDLKYKYYTKPTRTHTWNADLIYTNGVKVNEDKSKYTIITNRKTKKPDAKPFGKKDDDLKILGNFPVSKREEIHLVAKIETYINMLKRLAYMGFSPVNLVRFYRATIEEIGRAHV